MGLFQGIKERILSEEPAFFSKIQNLVLWIGTPATGVWVANQTMSLNLPEVVLTVCKYTIAVAAGMGLTAKLTKKNES